MFGPFALGEIMHFTDKLTDDEKQIVSQILDINGGIGGFIYPKEIADRLGVSHSQVIMPLRKLESSGNIRTTIKGMEGIFVEILKEEGLEL